MLQLIVTDDLLSLGGVSVSGQQVVRCKSDTNCAWSIGSVSQFECCVTFENGLTYIVPGLEGCFVCIGMLACDNTHFYNFCEVIMIILLSIVQS